MEFLNPITTAKKLLSFIFYLLSSRFMLKNRLTEGGICTVEPVYYLHGILSWSLYQPAAGSRLLLYNTRNIRNLSYLTLYIDEGLVERKGVWVEGL